MEQKLWIATGKNRFEKRWLNTEVTWEWLANRLATPTQTPETATEYRAMSRDMQTRVKDVGGFVGGLLRNGIRKVESVECRSVVTLDYDEFSESRLADVRGALRGLQWALHSTHKHSAEAWRVRLVIPLSRGVTPDEYGAIARRLAERCGFGGIDRSTFEACRLMFWPSHSKGAPWLFEQGEGARVDADDILGTYRDWTDMSTWPLLPEEELAGLFADRDGEPPADLPKMAAAVALRTAGRHGQQEDPLTKRGLIGAFCRTYNVTQAIETFLPETYRKHSRNRYTHEGSTTSGGGWVLDGGRFFYSWHSTDRVQGKLVNSWDLVRLHRFGDLDLRSEETQTARQPSFKAMEQLAMSDARTKATLMEERTGAALADFEGLDLSEEERDELKEWRLKCGEALTPAKDGSVKATAANLEFVLTGDPGLKGKIRLDEFAGKVFVFGDLPWKRQTTPKRPWSNLDHSDLRVYLDKRYGMSSKEKIRDALNSVSRAQGYHPILDYFDSLTWDGQKRLDKLFVDVLGARDSRLYRKLPELIMTAAVRRIKSPGCKFDYFVVLHGPEGIGKSTLWSVLGGEWFTDSITTIEGKEGMESIRGKWIIEMSELEGVRKSEQTKLKGFISSQVDSYRPAYGESIEDYPRQCIIVGTTNDEYFLRGLNAKNRRQPVVEIEPTRRNIRCSPREWLEANRDQLIAEAVTLEARGEPIWLDESYTAEIREIQDRHNLDKANTLFPEVERFLDFYLPPQWNDWKTKERIDWIERATDPTQPDILQSSVLRSTVTVAEILQECLGMKRTDKDYLTRGREIGQFIQSLKDWESVGVRRNKIYGGQKTWKRKQTTTEEVTTETASQAAADNQPKKRAEPADIWNQDFGCHPVDNLNDL